MNGDAVSLPLGELQQLAASLPMPSRCDFWRRTLAHADQVERGGAPSPAWDGCLRSLMEEQTTSLQSLLQGPVEPAESGGEAENPRCADGNDLFSSFAAVVDLLHSCDGWIANLADATRRQVLRQVLADRLVQLVGRLHQWLVIEEAEGGARAHWFWRAWELLEWRQAMTEPLPPWWPPVREQLVRLGALAWKERSTARDPGSQEGQQAIARALTLLQALVPLHDPLPIWIPIAQRELVEREEAASPGANHSAPAPLRRMLLVLGMHRSGTSALAGLLCQQGFQAPHNRDGGDTHNPTGYWEPRQIRAFHNSLLEGVQSSWEDPLLPVLPWQPQHLESALEQLEQALAADFPTTNPQAVALIKDPRQCRLLPLWTALFAQRPFQVAVVLAVRQPEAVAASLVSRDQLPLDRALLLWLSHTLEAERATRQLPRLVLSYEQLLQDPTAAVQRCQQLAGLPITTPSADLLGEWIRPGLNRHMSGAEGLEPKGETQTLLQWANTVYAALVEPAAEQQRQLLDRAQVVVQQKLQALLEQGSRRVQLQLFWEPETGGGFSEEASQRRSVMVERGRSRVVFQLPTGAERPRQLRLDLAEEPARVMVLAIRLRSPSGTLLWQWPATPNTPDQEQVLPVRGMNPNTLVLPGGVVLAATADPGVVLDVPDAVLQQLEAKAELELEALWQPLPQDVAKVALESKAASYTTNETP
jgi:hypothetical protein